MRQQQVVFDAYYRSLKGLKAPRNCELSFVFVNDNDASSSFVWPDDCLVLPAFDRPASAQYAIDNITHRWNVDTFEHLAKCKQLLLDYTKDQRFDYVFLVDSDLLLEPTTLLSVYATQVDICNAAFFTKWTPQDSALPQCWLSHPYGMAGLGMADYDYFRALNRHELIRVAGGGACVLIKTHVLEKAGYHPRLDLPMESMWQGEDRSFAICAERSHIRQYCDAWPRITHCYHPHQRTQAWMDEAWQQLNAPQQMLAKIGDWINITLTPMEDSQLQQVLDPRARCVRGRLGGLPLAPEIEAALLSMVVGDKIIVDYAVPAGHPAYPQGTNKAIMVELIDVQPR